MKQFGFTLIELIIVLILIGILSLISFPVYNNHIMRVRRAHIITTLMDVAGRIETYYLKNNTYNGANLTNLFVNSYSYKDYYDLNISVKDDFYTLEATPIGRQQNDPCGSLIVDQNGNRTASGENQNTQCWL